MEGSDWIRLAPKKTWPLRWRLALDGFLDDLRSKPGHDRFPRAGRCQRQVV